MGIHRSLLRTLIIRFAYLKVTIGQIIFELLRSLSIAAVVSGGMAWLTKSVISHFLSRKIEAYKEAYKIELKRESDKEIEEVKSRLQIVALERQIVFSRLHEKRAEIVAETYALKDCCATWDLSSSPGGSNLGWSKGRVALKR